MKKRNKELTLIGIGLVLLSLFLHYLHFLIFKDAHHTLIFLFADIAFIPMEVFFTTIVIDRLLEKREKSHLLEKLNMLIGVFYTEIGLTLLHAIVKGDENIEDIRSNCVINKKNEKLLFRNLQECIENHSYSIDINKIDLSFIKEELNKNKDLLITLIANENLLEHETFTEVLMAVLHLKDELSSRYCNNKICTNELKHIESDIESLYKYIAVEWVKYMKYVSKNYPALFTKALINNPFDTRSQEEKDYIFLSK